MTLFPFSKKQDNTEEFKRALEGYANQVIKEAFDKLNNNVTYKDFKIDKDIVGAVATCHSIVSDTVSKIPLHVYTSTTKAGKVKDKKHRLSFLTKRANNYTTYQKYMAAVIMQLMKWGNSWSKINTVSGFPVSFTLIDPSTVTKFRVQNDRLTWLIDDKWVAHDKLLHFHINSTDGIVGNSPITAVYKNINILHHSENTSENYYKNNITADKFLKVVPNVALDQKEFKNSLEKFSEGFSGSKKAGKIVQLPLFTEVQNIPLSFADAQIIDSQKWQTSQIASIYKIPAIFLNLDYGIANVEELFIVFKALAIEPLLRMIRQELEFKLLRSDEEETSIEFAVDALDTTNTAVKMEAFKKLHSVAAINSNEIRDYINKGNYEGGDAFFMQQQYKDKSNLNEKNDE